MLSNQIIDNLNNFEKNSKNVLDYNRLLFMNKIDSNLEQLFKTNFQIKYLFQRTDISMSYENFHKLEQNFN